MFQQFQQSYHPQIFKNSSLPGRLFHGTQHPKDLTARKRIAYDPVAWHPKPSLPAIQVAMMDLIDMEGLEFGEALNLILKTISLGQFFTLVFLHLHISRDHSMLNCHCNLCTVRESHTKVGSKIPSFFRMCLKFKNKDISCHSES